MTGKDPNRSLFLWYLGLAFGGRNASGLAFGGRNASELAFGGRNALGLAFGGRNAYQDSGDQD